MESIGAGPGDHLDLSASASHFSIDRSDNQFEFADQFRIQEHGRVHTGCPAHVVNRDTVSLQVNVRRADSGKGGTVGAECRAVRHGHAAHHLHEVENVAVHQRKFVDLLFRKRYTDR